MTTKKPTKKPASRPTPPRAKPLFTVMPTKHFRVTKAVFTKMLWLSPSDNHGARFNLAALEAGKTWDEMEGNS